MQLLWAFANKSNNEIKKLLMAYTISLKLILGINWAKSFISDWPCARWRHIIKKATKYCVEIWQHNDLTTKRSQTRARPVNYLKFRAAPGVWDLFHLLKVFKCERNKVCFTFKLPDTHCFRGWRGRSPVKNWPNEDKGFTESEILTV